MLDLYYSDWFLNYAKKLFWHNNVNESVEDVLKQLGNKLEVILNEEST